MAGHSDHSGSSRATNRLASGEPIDLVLCDLDGVIWLAHRPIEGSVAAVAALRERAVDVLFVTNNSSARVAVHEEALAAIGVPATGHVVTSAHAAARCVAPGERVLFGGGPGVEEALLERGADVVSAVGAEYADIADGPGFDAVVVGMYRSFDYDSLDVLSRSIRRGARFVATNDDATYPTPSGLAPGGGSIVAAVATASGVAPTIAGKPHHPMVAAVAASRPGLDPARTLMVGDRWSTDGAFAAAVGCRFAQVRSGVSPPGAQLEGNPAYDGADLAAVVAALIGSY